MVIVKKNKFFKILLKEAKKVKCQQHKQAEYNNRQYRLETGTFCSDYC